MEGKKETTSCCITPTPKTTMPRNICYKLSPAPATESHLYNNAKVHQTNGTLHPHFPLNSLALAKWHSHNNNETTPTFYLNVLFISKLENNKRGAFLDFEHYQVTIYFFKIPQYGNHTAPTGLDKTSVMTAEEEIGSEFSGLTGREGLSKKKR